MDLGGGSGDLDLLGRGDLDDLLGNGDLLDNRGLGDLDLRYTGDLDLLIGLFVRVVSDKTFGERDRVVGGGELRIGDGLRSEGTGDDLFFITTLFSLGEGAADFGAGGASLAGGDLFLVSATSFFTGS